MVISERETQAQLDLTRYASRIPDAPKIRTGDSGVGRIELRVVEGIVKLRLEREFDAFFDEEAFRRGNRGRVEAYEIPTPSRMVFVGKIKDRISPEAEMVVTDQLLFYKSIGKTHRHEVIDHIRQWVRGNVHTNSIENFWSMFKPGVIGSFHKVSANHQSRYLAEFAYRFSYREADDLFSMTLMCLLSNRGMSYKNLVASD